MKCEENVGLDLDGAKSCPFSAGPASGAGFVALLAHVLQRDDASSFR